MRQLVASARWILLKRFKYTEFTSMDLRRYCSQTTKKSLFQILPLYVDYSRLLIWSPQHSTHIPTGRWRYTARSWKPCCVSKICEWSTTKLGWVRFCIYVCLQQLCTPFYKTGFIRHSIWCSTGLFWTSHWNLQHSLRWKFPLPNKKLIFWLHYSTH